MILTPYLNLEDEIFDIICNNPGIHFRGILEKCGREVGVVTYHLKILKKENAILSISHRKRVLYFDHSWSDRVNEVELLISYLRKRQSREILLFLTDPANQQLALKELAARLDRSPSNLQWHVKKLIDDHLVQPIRKGRKIILKLLVEEKILNHLGKEVFPSRWEQFLDEIEDKFGR